MSSSKGIISGPLQIYLPENLIIDCSIHKTGNINLTSSFITEDNHKLHPELNCHFCWVYVLLGMTLPHFTADIGTLTTTADYVLVVEKDTVFKKLVQCNIMDRWNHKCILITVSKSIFTFKKSTEYFGNFILRAHRVKAIRT